MESTFVHIMSFVLWSIGGGLFAVLVGFAVRNLQDLSEYITSNSDLRRVAASGITSDRLPK